MNIDNRENLIMDILEQRDSPRYVATQIFDDMFKRYVKRFSEMTSLSKELRTELSETFGDEVLSLSVVSEVKGDQANKVLFSTKDGHRIEAVLMTYLPNSKREYAHNALCISSQSGCGLGCKFCATGGIGFKKNLTADEIVDQVLYFLQKGIEIHTVFFSGMGEPLANPNVFDALTLLTDKRFFGYGQRKISISTVGIVPGIQRVTQEFPQVNLAFSLHSPDNKQRQDLMPITKAYPIWDVMKALTAHVETTNRKVFIAYLLLKDINDSLDHAAQLAKLIRHTGKKRYLFHVNLIKYHPSEKAEFSTPATSRVMAFKQLLEKWHINVTIRQDFGLDIEGACGQLYAKYGRKTKEKA